jgi:hypothetical protein
MKHLAAARAGTERFTETDVSQIDVVKPLFLQAR